MSGKKKAVLISTIVVLVLVVICGIVLFFIDFNRDLENFKEDASKSETDVRVGDASSLDLRVLCDRLTEGYSHEGVEYIYYEDTNEVVCTSILDITVFIKYDYSFNTLNINIEGYDDKDIEVSDDMWFGDLCDEIYSTISNYLVL